MKAPSKEEHIEVEGVVTTVLPGTMFRVELDNKHVVLATICGKMRKRWVRLAPEDAAEVARGNLEGFSRFLEGKCRAGIALAHVFRGRGDEG